MDHRRSTPPAPAGADRGRATTPLDCRVWRAEAEHLHGLGSRALAELLAEMAPVVGADRLRATLAGYVRLSPDHLRVTGGHHFPAEGLGLRIVGRRGDG